MRALASRTLGWCQGWRLWSEAPRVLAYVLATEVVAVVAAVATVGSEPISGLDWIRFAMLALGVLVHLGLAARIDRYRTVTDRSRPTWDTESVWSFAAVLILPTVLAAVMVVFAYGWGWVWAWRGRRPLYRWVFSAATVVIATRVAAMVLSIRPGLHPGLPTGLWSLAVVVLAASLRLGVNYSLVVGAVMVYTRRLRWTNFLSMDDEFLPEAGTLGLGLVVAGLVVYNPWLLLGMPVGLLAMHRSVLLPEYRAAVSLDDRTGLYNAVWWRRTAQDALDRAGQAGSCLAVLMLDLDHFKRVNDTHGHLAGDQVLEAVGQAIGAEVRTDHAAGRWGGEEFVVLATDTGPIEATAIAERIRRRISDLVVQVQTISGPDVVRELTVSVGIATYPVFGIHTLEELLRAADAALYRAKATGRDRIQLNTGS